MGRKPSEDPSTVISVRLTGTELAQLDEITAFIGGSRTEAVKLAVKMTWLSTKRVKEKKSANP